MAPVQTARLPISGPLWDEEVVPALRKRLESESLTLAKRISAISLSSQDDYSATTPADSPSASVYAASRDTFSAPFFQSNASTSARKQYQQPDTRASLDRIPTSSSRVSNGVTTTPTKRKLQSPSPTPSFQRSRTYSQPYLTELPNGKPSRQKPHPNTQISTKSPRISDTKPTRIPQPAPRSPSLIAHDARTISAPNGNYQYTTTTPPQDLYHGHPSPHIPTTPLQNHYTPVNTNRGLGLLHEPPPFNPASASSSITPSPDSEPDPVRPSMESEEHPFEHWYRGEVSRNGGVGELRIGRRQEMLDIANYGHTIREIDNKRRRKRADSVSGSIGLGEVAKEVGRERERESLYLEDYETRDADRVLDEAPLTDLEGSDGRGNEIYGGYELSDEDREDVTQKFNYPTPEATSYQARSLTPTSFSQIQQRPSSRNANPPPSRIPARPRQSSESHVMPTTTAQVARGNSETTITPPNGTISKSTSPPPTRQRQQSRPTPTGRAASKTRSPAPKTPRAKTLSSKKELDDEAKRRSVAYYPTPGEGDEAIIDAIPEWTQPVPKEGNWDEVVLPVVARKRGLEEHYQKADGKPTPRKSDNLVAPAPGTFGFDHSKYHASRADKRPDFIPMDEFGLAKQQPQVQHAPSEGGGIIHADVGTPRHNDMVLPVHAAHSPPAFSDYMHPTRPAPAADAVADGNVRQDQDQEKEKDDGGGGCCKCTIM